ncbi:MAG TPA: hypothetical protein VFP93_02785 [Gammaproteobacteria bacterium]|nr:hypothetical protein [Gammaproteobacteria bacterium]
MGFLDKVKDKAEALKKEAQSMAQKAGQTATSAKERAQQMAGKGTPKTTARAEDSTFSADLQNLYDKANKIESQSKELSQNAKLLRQSIQQLEQKIKQAFATVSTPTSPVGPEVQTEQVPPSPVIENEDAEQSNRKKKPQDVKKL